MFVISEEKFFYTAKIKAFTFMGGIAQIIHKFDFIFFYTLNISGYILRKHTIIKKYIRLKEGFS